ncbi:Fe-S cluster assembly protein SufD [Clostridium massiliamazoniense]|uniref:Fe-S cluster assembly protein SufD n=1 Tax=Clostridium massiliamazoniense TaxID=1347366 RepID=UPI0006D7A158|nr:Fe-S cluster assembly protein SufD [Clostridium massiliamazoniense]
MRFDNLNKIPVRTAVIQEVNDISLNISEFKINEFNNFNIEPLKENGVEIKSLEHNSELLKDLKYGVSKELLEEVDKNFTNGIVLEIADNIDVKENIVLNFNMDSNNNTLVDNIVIVAGKDSKANIIIKYSSDKDLDGYHNGVLRVFAKDNANIKVSKVNLLGKNIKNFDSNMSEVGENATVDFIGIDLGGNSTVTNYEAILNGNKSKADASAIYVGSDNEKIDMNYVMTIKGEKVNTNINVKGALKDKALKNFKGTLDFKKGAKKSKGAEEEYCMLLSEKARSRSVPLLLCEEEDVSGEHAAASGTIDENKLFYLMSRGISYEEARILIINAAFNPIIDKIGSEHIENEIVSYIKEVLA